MHSDISKWKHHHNYIGEFELAEKSTRRVLMLTIVMMIAEIVGGLKLHSMALFADGCHMGTHVAAFLIAAGAYFFTRRHANDPAVQFRHRQSRCAWRIHQCDCARHHWHIHGD